MVWKNSEAGIGSVEGAGHH